MCLDAVDSDVYMNVCTCYLHDERMCVRLGECECVCVVFVLQAQQAQKLAKSGEEEYIYQLADAVKDRLVVLQEQVHTLVSFSCETTFA